MSEQLSPRELEVLRAMYYGKTNFEIGKILNISELTAKTHAAKIIKKLGVRTRTRAVTLALEFKLMALDPWHNAKGGKSP